MQEIIDSGWTPNKWIATILAFLFQPLGMLYLAKLKLATIYFLASLGVSITEIYLSKNGLLLWGEYFSLMYLLMIACAFHAYKIAKSCAPTVTRPWYSRWYGLISFPMTIFILVFCFRSFIYEPFRFSSSSMLPTINAGDILITKKWGYGNYGTYGVNLFKSKLSQQLQKGDILVFEYPNNRDIPYAMRLIALPGDTIEYKNKELIVNGEKLVAELVSNEDDHVLIKEVSDKNEYRIIITKDRPTINGSFIVPDNSYFVFGDNRDNSNDSRYWGGVPEDAIIGKVVHIFK